MKKLVLKIASFILIIATLATPLSACGKPDVYVVEMEVEGYGVITMRLMRKMAPKTVNNFVKLAKKDYYDGLTFNRAQEGFVLQGGDGTGKKDMKLKPIIGEFLYNGYTKNTIKHTAGVISMARTNDPDSATSQFFITIGDARSSLDGRYAAFGYIDEESMAIVYKIAEDMIPHGDPDNLGFVTDVTKQAVIKDVRIIDP